MKEGHIQLQNEQSGIGVGLSTADALIKHLGGQLEIK